MMKNPSLQSPQENPIKTDRIHGDVGKKILMISGSFSSRKNQKGSKASPFYDRRLGACAAAPGTTR